MEGGESNNLVAFRQVDSVGESLRQGDDMSRNRALQRRQAQEYQAFAVRLSLPGTHKHHGKQDLQNAVQNSSQAVKKLGKGSKIFDESTHSRVSRFARVSVEKPAFHGHLPLP